MKTARIVLALLKRTLFLLRRRGKRDGPRLLALASDAVLSLFKSRELDYPDVQLLRTITSRPHAALKQVSYQLFNQSIQNSLKVDQSVLFLFEDHIQSCLLQLFQVLLQHLDLLV